jgi:hypothetical protein
MEGQRIRWKGEEGDRKRRRGEGGGEKRGKGCIHTEREQCSARDDREQQIICVICNNLSALHCSAG